MDLRAKRRRFPIVNRSHQYRFLALVIIYSAIVGGVMAGFVFFPEFDRLHDPALGRIERAQVADKILTMHARIWPVLIVLISVIGLHSFVVFHRFVGPLYRFTKAFEQVSQGRLDCRVQLRKGDYLLNEEEQLNRMIDTLAQHQAALQQALDLVTRDIADLRHFLTAQNLPTMSDPIGALEGHLRQALELTAGFQVASTDKPDQAPAA